MSWSLTVYSLPPFVAALLSLPAGVEAWRNREEPAASALFAVICVLFGWSLVYGVQLGFAELGAKLFWQRLSLLVGSLIPALWLVFCLRYAGLDRYLTRRTTALLYCRWFKLPYVKVGISITIVLG